MRREDARPTPAKRSRVARATRSAPTGWSARYRSTLTLSWRSRKCSRSRAAMRSLGRGRITSACRRPNSSSPPPTRAATTASSCTQGCSHRTTTISARRPHWTREGGEQAGEHLSLSETPSVRRISVGSSGAAPCAWSNRGRKGVQRAHRFGPGVSFADYALTLPNTPRLSVRPQTVSAERGVSVLASWVLSRLSLA